MTLTDNRPSPTVIRGGKLGEELPIFCERCGYSLNGLQQIRCEHCQVLQFHCPECGHHQPINTLRPAAQRIIGRLRAVWLVAVVLFKLNFFGWLLIAWVGMGGAWSYAYNYKAVRTTASQITWEPRDVDTEEIIAFTLLALAFSMIGRMLLLRWKHAERIGVILAIIVSLMIVLGATLAYRDYSDVVRVQKIQPPWTAQFIAIIIWTAGVVVIGAILVWPAWVGLVRTFLPKAMGTALLEWQRSMSDRTVPPDRAIPALGRG